MRTADGNCIGVKVTLLVITLNELEGLKVVMPRVDPSWCDQIIIADGGSTDGSLEWAKEHGYTVLVQSKPGLRHAYSESLELIEGDIVVTFSPDGNSIPELIPDLTRKMKEGYDMVIASRYLGDAKSEDDDMVTAFGNWLFARTVNLLYGGHYTDTVVIFRTWKKTLFTDLDLHRDEGFQPFEKFFRTTLGPEPLMSVRALKRNLKIGEIPGDEPPRIGGERKLQVFKWGASFLLIFFRELWFWK